MSAIRRPQGRDHETAVRRTARRAGICGSDCHIGLGRHAGLPAGTGLLPPVRALDPMVAVAPATPTESHSFNAALWAGASGGSVALALGLAALWFRRRWA